MSALQERDPNIGIPPPRVEIVEDSETSVPYCKNGPSGEAILVIPRSLAKPSQLQGLPAKRVPAKPKTRKANLSDEARALMFPENVELPDDDAPEVQPAADEDCDVTRQKMRRWVDSGAMKIGEFREALGVGAGSYANFMEKEGARQGEQSDTYVPAVRFFKKREVAGLLLSLPQDKKPKTAAEKRQDEARKKGKETQTGANALVDTGGVELDGEEEGKVPIYMTCTEVRKGLRALLAKGLANAALCRALTRQYPEGSDKSVSPANLRYFMDQKGVVGGSSSLAFYAGCCLLEKLRIKKGKPKSGFRYEMEAMHGPDGLETKQNQSYIVSAGRTPYINQYGGVTTY
ncbi:hypothetical protein LIA77_08996 [Sarocladium implicatum]|nr:hypothetical protein LIA77_08996 [Sarocladium implicatum]